MSSGTLECARPGERPYPSSCHDQVAEWPETEGGRPHMRHAVSFSPLPIIGSHGDRCQPSPSLRSVAHVVNKSPIHVRHILAPSTQAAIPVKYAHHDKTYGQVCPCFR
jgi:hypothetical protein